MTRSNVNSFFWGFQTELFKLGQFLTQFHKVRLLSHSPFCIFVEISTLLGDSIKVDGRMKKCSPLSSRSLPLNKQVSLIRVISLTLGNLFLLSFCHSNSLPPT